MTFFPGNFLNGGPTDPAPIRFWQGHAVAGGRPTFADITTAATVPGGGTPVIGNTLVGPAEPPATGTVPAVDPATGLPNPVLFGDIYDLEVCDIDGDGDEDLIAARQPHRDLIYEMQNGVMIDLRAFAPTANHASEYFLVANASEASTFGVSIGSPIPVRWTTGVDSWDQNDDLRIDVVVLSYRCSHSRVFVHNEATGSAANFALVGDLPDFIDEVWNPATTPGSARPDWWPPEFPDPQNPNPQPATFPVPTAWARPGNGGRGIEIDDLDADALPEVILTRTNNVDPRLSAEVSAVAVYHNVGTATAPSLVPWYKLMPPSFGRWRCRRGRSCWG